VSATTDYHPLRLQQVQREADHALVLGFELPPVFRFEAGQHLGLRATVNGQELRRSYSICAAPGEPLRVGVRAVAGGAFTGWLHAQARPGLMLDVMPPQGRFGAALASRPRHVLAVAGGSGITPLLSIVKAVLAGGAQARCTLLYGNRRVASTMFREELEDLKNRHLARLALHPVFSREAVDSPLHSGRLDAGKITTLLRLAGPVDQAFVCGPHTMNDEVEAALHAAGLPAERVHVERFGVPPALAAAPAHGAVLAPAGRAQTAKTVRIVRDGVARDVAFSPEDGHILAAATRAGLDLPYSCSSGVCATCRARVLEGQVQMHRNFALEAAEVAAGFVLTCQAQPLSPRVVLSFDER
jgi:ring-1,2-phenylacetyl-CoA epoxidase subunit PaaE